MATRTAIGGSHVRMEPLKVVKFSQCSSSVRIRLKPVGHAAYVACLPLLCQGSKWLSGNSIWLVFRRSLVNCWTFCMCSSPVHFAFKLKAYSIVSLRTYQGILIQAHIFLFPLHAICWRLRLTEFMWNMILVILYIGQAQFMGYSTMNFCCHGNLTGYIQCSYRNNWGCEYNQKSDAWLHTSYDTDVDVIYCCLDMRCFMVL